MHRVNGEADEKPNPVELIGSFPPRTKDAERADAFEKKPKPASQSRPDEDVPDRDDEVVGEASGLENPRCPPLRFHEEEKIGEGSGENADSPQKIVTRTVSDALGFHAGRKLGANS